MKLSKGYRKEALLSRKINFASDFKLNVLMIGYVLNPLGDIIRIQSYKVLGVL